jgi:hypothetical protein
VRARLELLERQPLEIRDVDRIGDAQKAIHRPVEGIGSADEGEVGEIRRGK